MLIFGLAKVPVSPHAASLFPGLGFLGREKNNDKNPFFCAGSIEETALGVKKKPTVTPEAGLWRPVFPILQSKVFKGLFYHLLVLDEAYHSHGSSALWTCNRVRIKVRDLALWLKRKLPVVPM